MYKKRISAFNSEYFKCDIVEFILIRVVKIKDYNLSHSLSHTFADMSLGITRPPRGDREITPTAGPSFKQERLNCCWKKRLINVVSHFFMHSLSYLPSNAFFAKKNIFETENP